MREDTVTVRDFLNSIFFYRRAAMLIVLAVLLAGVAAAVLVPPIYTSRARLLTLNASVYDMQPGTTASAPVQDPTAAVNTEMQLLASSELHRNLVRSELGAGATPDQINREVRRFEAHFHLSKVESANVIELEYSAQNPQDAAAKLRALLDGYFKERADVLTSGRVDFLAAQRDKVRAQLDATDAEIAGFEKQNGIVDVGAQINGAVDFDNQLHQQQQLAQAALADSRRGVIVLLDNARDVPRQVELYSDNTEATHTVGTMEASLFQLEAKRADLASRYMAGSPFVKEVDKQIADMKAAIAAQKIQLAPARRTGLNTDYDTVQDRVIQAEANAKGAAARLSVLNGQVAASRDHLKSLIAVSDRLTQLRTQRDLLAETVRNYSTQLEQARIQQNQATTAGSTNVRVIEAPVAPSRRDNPPLLMLAASVFCALLIAAVTVFVLSSVRETFLSPDEVERALKVPVLCDLPQQGPQRSHFGRVIATIAGASAAAGAAGKVVLLLSPRSESELEKTTQLLAAALAQREPGGVAVLRLGENAVAGPVRMEDGIANLSGDIAMSRERLQGVVQELRRTYAFTVMLPPPTAASYESVECSAVADLVFVIVRAEQTRRPVVQAMLGQVTQMGGEVQGVIMTGRKLHIPGWIYRLVLNQRPSTA